MITATILSVAMSAAMAGDSLPDGALSEAAWHTSYAKAMQEAKDQKKMLLIYFESPDEKADTRCRRFRQEVLSDATVIAKMRDYVRLRMPTDATIRSGGKDVRVLKHPAFREMLGRPGLAIIDYASEGKSYYGRVVSTFPLADNLHYSPDRVKVILGLPPGTLTQRTLIYAVRIHPDGPRSTHGQLSETLLHEARSHSEHQADIQLQGHHNWESRFHQINRRLPRGLMAVEVCAESWPGENLVEAAIECVRCWRFSSGHWSAVRAHHPRFGYDMRRGRNGIWYATGIFGRR